jgi:two-component system, cell cycle sensor histidine kinase and response regulator CckA
MGEMLQILLVDDDEDDYTLTRDKLKEIPNLKYDLKWVTTYDSAVNWLTNNVYSVCITDYNLRAGKTGLDLVDEMISKGCPVPFIVLTGQGTLQLCTEAGRRGAAAFFDKASVTPIQLAQAIERAMKAARTTEQLRRTEEQLRRVTGK